MWFYPIGNFWALWMERNRATFEGEESLVTSFKDIWFRTIHHWRAGKSFNAEEDCFSLLIIYVVCNFEHIRC